jgi:hypothetical protein
MKVFSVITLVLFSFAVCAASCSKEDKPLIMDNNNQTTSKMKITIDGTVVFTATLYNNATANAFKEMLPLSINMSELNDNEKYYYFQSALPTNASSGGNIQSGDLMLYGNNCLVLFYENFNTSYSYTRLGKVDNPSALKTALGTGNVMVKFELE